MNGQIIPFVSKFKFVFLAVDVMLGRRAAERGGATGAFCPGPHSAYGPQKIDIL